MRRFCRAMVVAGALPIAVGGSSEGQVAGFAGGGVAEPVISMDSGQFLPSEWIEHDPGDGTYWGATPFRESTFAAAAHPGAPEFPSSGFPHFDFPNRHYGHWYRPMAFGLGPAQRCSPAPWRPRGYGNLGARPATCYRMDYAPYVLEDAGSRFGPAYYRRHGDERCGCGCCGVCCERIAQGPDSRAWMPTSLKKLLHRQASCECR